ncbi:synaptonemal complex protein 1 [Cucurbita pepo subsp. pepo]|uniref:synaptonemal complex protein 1 n=1 Tax=Cucurbita pepo subsp. pepo TaxID=3664 RepID=UPI000C9D86E8|nr:synaptonemal complex protein 1 [Cucurbita pepo subsp. pepo]
MLEKIGLPARPSLRGNNWVVDASHCQGCSSQFTFINRKHHCRRCGGIFCGSCTQQRMVLRGQGDSPVRICDPCKKLEEAARFELRHGHKSRAGRGSLKSTKPEDDILAKILGSDRNESSSSVQESNANSSSTIGRTTTGIQSSNTPEFIDLDGEGEASSSLTNHLENKMESSSPEQLRQQAVDEKKKYKVLKGEGKSEEALKAFKRGKELERKADALEISIRKSRRKALTSGNAGEDQNIGGSSGRNMKPSLQSSKEKHDLNAELRELGWSDMDIHAEEKKSATMSLEGELSSLLGGVLQKTDKAKSVHSIDNTQVVAHKRKALMLKREGKLAEAKEELKKAKILEKQLEEQELLGGADEESDDELSALVRSLDDNKHEDISFQYKGNLDLDLDNLLGAANNIISDVNFEVTDEDMEDPEISAALETLGWTEDSQPSASRESIKSEIISLKREALNQKRAGNIAVAMEQLKKAKMLERDLENCSSQEDSHVSGGSTVETTEVLIPKLPSKNKLAIQKELLAIKKKALALRREGRLDEAEKELNKCKVLEEQLEQAADASRGNIREVGVGIGSKDPDFLSKDLNRNLQDVEVVEDVTDQEMHDPEYLSVLKNLGWNDKDDELVPSKPSKQDDLLPAEPSETSANDSPEYAVKPLRKKAEVQRELLRLKRKALSLRRQGETEEAEEVLIRTKALEAEMEDIERRDRVRTVYSGNQENVHKAPSGRLVDEGDGGDVTEEDMNDPTLLSVLQNLGWNGDEVEPPVNKQVKPINEDAKLTVNQPSSTINVAAPQSRSEIQREVLNLKRKALAFRRRGDIDEAEEVLKRAKALEIQMDELDTPKPTGVFDAADKSEVLRALKGDELLDRVKDVGEVRNGSDKVAEDLKDEVPDLSLNLKFSKGDSVHNRQSDRLNFKERQASFREGASGGNTSLEGNGRQGDLSIPRSDVLSNAADRSTEVGFQAISTAPNQDHFSIGNQDDVVRHEGKQRYQADNSSQDSSSQSSQSFLRQEILAHKKKAVTLKREGKLSEAREELRQAKRLEKSLEENNGQVQLNSKSSTISTNNVPSPDRKESSTSTVEQKPSPDRKQSSTSVAEQKPSPDRKQGSPSTMDQKPMSARDRFKLQQESLKHKRQALKFRREGRTEEADAEFEKAKAIENQLEQLTDSAKSSMNGEEHAGDVSVEDFLDPQLLSALKAIGLENPAPSISRGQQETLKPPPRVSTDKMENTDLERNQLEERIKAEKVKAVHLKRQGKQAEALDALRRAKLYEKKLNSLASN